MFFCENTENGTAENFRHPTNWLQLSHHVVHAVHAGLLIHQELRRTQSARSKHGRACRAASTSPLATQHRPFSGPDAFRRLKREETATNPFVFGMDSVEAATHCLKGVETLTSGMESTGMIPTSLTLWSGL